MSQLIDNYEQQYAVLTADITAKIVQLSQLTGNDKRSTIQDIDRMVEEAQELLEQIELEVRTVSGTSRNHLKLRVESHRAELKRLSQEFQNTLNPNNQHSPDDENWENIVTEDQKRRLLDTSEKIERTGKNLQNGYSIALETEEIGTQVLRDLHDQRETIQRGRGRLRDTNSELNRGSRLLSGMIFRAIQQKIIVISVFVVLMFVTSSVIYFKFKSKE